MNRETIHDATNDARIDRVLGSIGSAVPASGFEGRILNRLAAQRVVLESKPLALFRLGRLPRISRQVLGVTTACVLSFGIIAGSVSHSRRMGHLAAPPVLPMAGQGIGAASAVHPAAPATTPAPAGDSGRASRSPEPSADQGRTQGRARIAPHSRKAPGAVPAPPAK
jgi:hypothetical protein